MSAYAELVERARADEDVLGLILTGSRGRGFRVRPDSDWDVRLVLRDGALRTLFHDRITNCWFEQSY